MNILYLGNDTTVPQIIQSQFEDTVDLMIKVAPLKNDLDFILLVDAISKREESVFNVDCYIVNSQGVDPMLFGYLVGILSTTAPVMCAEHLFEKNPYLTYNIMVDDVMGRNLGALRVYDKILRTYQRGSEEFVNAVINGLEPFRKRK